MDLLANKIHVKPRFLMLYFIFASIPSIAAASKVGLIGIPLYLSLANLRLNNFPSIIRSISTTKIIFFMFSILIFAYFLIFSVNVLFDESYNVIDMVLNVFQGRYYNNNGVETSLAYLRDVSLYDVSLGRSLQLSSAAFDSELVFIFYSTGLIGVTFYFALFQFRFYKFKALFLPDNQQRKHSAAVFTLILASLGSFLLYNPRTSPITCFALYLLTSNMKSFDPE